MILKEETIEYVGHADPGVGRSSASWAPPPPPQSLYTLRRFSLHIFKAFFKASYDSSAETMVSDEYFHIFMIKQMQFIDAYWRIHALV